MTHAEAKDLLLEHAYGELPAHVAAEVAEHLVGCDECQKEQAGIDSVRASFAPLAGVEEPGAGFDGRVLAAARAEAQLTHDGNIGEVVDVTASEAPSGIEAASIDAYARPLPPPAERRRPKWMKAAAAAASVAAVAALAVVVGSPNGRKPPAPQETYEIHVAPQVAASRVSHAADESAQRQVEERQAQAARQQPDEPRPAALAAQSQPVPAAAPERRKAAAKKRAVEEGSGGDLPTAGELAARDAQRGAAAGAANAQKPAVTQQIARSAAAQPPPNVPPPPPAAAVKAVPPPPVAAETSNRAVARTDAQPTTDEAPPPELERRAGAARRSGDYPLAAALYRKAAQGRTDDASSAAWDLAHAVECLSAAGSFDEARAARDELKQRYPAESGAFSAARRALREVDSRE